MSGVPLSLWDEQDAAEWSELPSDSVVTLVKPFHVTDLLHAMYRLTGVSMASSALGNLEWPIALAPVFHGPESPQGHNP